MLIKVSKNNIHIEDSYKVNRKDDMQIVLTDIRADYSLEESDVLKRTDKSLIKEWYVHNVLYNLNLFREHTKDVDLNYPQSKIIEIAYSVAYFIVSIFN